MMISINCSWRSARLSAEFMKLAISPAAPFKRMLERPLVAAGRLTPTRRPMRATTTMSSMRVTPYRSLTVAARKARKVAARKADEAIEARLRLFPADDNGIVALTTGLAVASEADDIGLIAMLAGVLV